MMAKHNIAKWICLLILFPMLFLQVSVWYVNNLRNSIMINSTTDQLEIALFFRGP